MDDDLMVVARYPTEAEALEAARSLVERGVGATVERLPAPPEPSSPGEDPAPASSTELSAGSPSGTLTGPPPGPLTGPPTGPPSDPPPADPAAVDDGDGDVETPWPLQDLDDVPGTGRWGVCAVWVDARRAAVLLGFDEPAQIDDPESELDKAPVPWKSILVIWAIAMVVLPLAAFAASYYLSGGG